jgi:hypothetical protein
MPTPTTVQQSPAPAPSPAAPSLLGTPQPAAQQFTRIEVAALRARREELSNQLQSAAARRSQLAEELKNADDGARAGLEQRIAVLDERIVQLERDIAVTGHELTSAPAGLVAVSGTPYGGFAGLGSDQITGISIVFVVLVLFPIAIAMARLLWKRATTHAPPPLPGETSQRLERLEQAMDSVALEMERVSEGQRFMTRILTEARPESNALAALEAGRQATDARVSRERVPVRGRNEEA